MNCYIVSNPDEYNWFSSLSMYLWYSLCLYSCKKLIEDYNNDNNNNNNNDNDNNDNDNDNNDNDNDTETENLLNEITNIPKFILSSIKESHDDEYKQKMFQELLDMNSLERCYILYFIFKHKGNFKSLTSIEYINNELTTILTNSYTNIIDVEDKDEEKVIYEDSDIETPDENTEEEETEEATEEDTLEVEVEITKETESKTPELTTYNSYELYDKIMNKLDLNLDETTIPDIQIQIGENKYELTEEKLNFIQWLYYIGLYDYLTDINNIGIKYDILNEMNEIGLLTGNLFLRYQLFLCDYEYEYKKKLSF